MKALVYHGTKDLRYQDFADPHVAAGEVLLRIKCSGLCHTDFNEYVNSPLYVAATADYKRSLWFRKSFRSMRPGTI
jgi:(R,R)-butanediol dehydrogenase/meso-butanediol dehydrogenase/diacetyl reductase